MLGLDLRLKIWFPPFRCSLDTASWCSGSACRGGGWAEGPCGCENMTEGTYGGGGKEGFGLVVRKSFYKERMLKLKFGESVGIIYVE